MLIINRLLVVVAALWVCSSAKGDTRLDTPLDRYILDSDVIAIVEVGAREKDLGGEGKYRLTTEATVKRVLKGEVPKTIKVLHGMGFDGLLFQNGAGLYLVFLSNGVEAYTPFDGWPSSKLIKDEKVLGWEHHPYFWYDSGTALQSALDKIEALLKSGKTSAPAGQPPATGLSESPKLAPAKEEVIKLLSGQLKKGDIRFEVLRATVAEHLSTDVNAEGVEFGSLLSSQAMAIDAMLDVFKSVSLTEEERVRGCLDCAAFLARLKSCSIPDYKDKPVTSNVVPPPGVQNAFAGMDPALIADPILRAKYEADIAQNLRNIRENKLQRMIPKVLLFQGARFAYYVNRESKQPKLREVLSKDLQQKGFSDVEIESVFGKTSR